jgi:DNA-binding NarL/FixJ family response regulator
MDTDMDMDMDTTQQQNPSTTPSPHLCGQVPGWSPGGPTPWAVLLADPDPDAYPEAHRGIHTGPYPDTDTDTVLNDAIERLAPMRTPYWLADTAVTIHLLASLQQQITKRLPDAVAEALDQGYTWDDIANQLAITPSTARRRYRQH